MLFSVRSSSQYSRLALPLMLMASLIACRTTPLETSATPVMRSMPDVVTTPVIRHGRYTLVELRPDQPQQNLLQQVIDLNMPPLPDATVGDGLRYVLLRSGYQLCDSGDAIHSLYPLPLPAPHLNIGPMTLRDALQTLAGPAWQLQIDEGGRRVCFASTWINSSPDADLVERTQVQP